MTSCIGLVIFATPTLYKGASVAVLYLLMAGATAAAAIVMQVMTRTRSHLIHEA
jgi:hypothetical protein